MTNYERIVVSAYTGYLMTDMADVHKYVEEKLGRPVWTHEMAFPEIQQEIHMACRDDFLALCGRDQLEGQMRGNAKEANE